MKKLLAILIFALYSAGMASAIESPLFAKVVFIQKVTSHEKGYKVNYFTGHGELKTVYVPLEWFYQTGGYKTSDGFIKAEAVRGSGGAYPYMQIFWKDGKFHHLRLFVVEDYNDRSWGIVNPAEKLETKFDPTKIPDFQF